MKRFSNVVTLLMLTFQSTFAQNAEQFEAHFSSQFNHTLIAPGASISIINDGEVMFKSSYGYSNLEYNLPLTNESVYDIASLSKQFTGFAVAKLVLEKKLHLEDAVIDYIPELKHLDSSVKIKHLVYHTSGIRDIGELFAISNYSKELTSSTALELMQHVKDFNFNPGSEYDYSNTNYVLLAIIVERITKMKFKDWADENIFTPLKMENTFVNDNPKTVIKNRCVAYYPSDQGFEFIQNNGMSLIGSSSVYSTINDMTLWVLALTSEDQFKEEFSLMKTPGEKRNGEKVGYGFGLAIGQYQNHKKIDHSGATPAGFRTQMVIFPDDNISMVILSNDGHFNPISDAGLFVFDSFFPEELDNEKGLLETESVPKVELSKETLLDVVGEYLFNNESKVSISHIDSTRLFVQLESNPKVEMFQIGENKFSIPQIHSTLYFSDPTINGFLSAKIYSDGQKQGELKRKLTKDEFIDPHIYVGLYYNEELNVVLQVVEEEGQLYFLQSKLGRVLLNPKSKLVFQAEGIASSITFTTDQHENLTGLLLNRGSRLRNLKFKKLLI